MSRTHHGWRSIAAAVLLLLGACAATETQRSTGEYIDDASITAQVKSQLARSPQVDALDINVNTYKGVVQLSGFADTQSQINQALELARDVKGVRQVNNDMRLKNAPG